jgi:membrane associated rhomboid family serine protease
VFITTVAVPAFFMLGYWFLLQVLGGFSSIGASGGGTAFWAHVGGFVAGAALIRFFEVPALVNRHPYHGWSQKKAPTLNWRRVR